MSRASLSVHVLDGIEEIINELEQREHLSRASLQRQLRRLLVFSLGNAASAPANSGT